MTELEIESTMHPLTKAMLTLLTALLGFTLIGPLIGFFFSIPFFEGNITEQMTKLAAPESYPEFRLPLYIMQGCATFIGLALLPALLSFIIERKGLIKFFTENKIYGSMFGIVIFIVMSFVVVDSIFIQWNANIHFPEFMNGFESWARNYEDKAESLTKYMTQFTSTGDFVIAFIVIAVLPGIGEELVFRGMLQTYLYKSSKNIHLAIWVSAFLFSAFHMQFFGFVPRMLLGALFGYLYYWSGNLLVPAFAHFLNNGLSVTAIYLNQLGVIDVDMDSTDTVAPWPAVIVCAIIGAALLYYFKNFFEQKKQLGNGR